MFTCSFGPASRIGLSTKGPIGKVISGAARYRWMDIHADCYIGEVLAHPGCEGPEDVPAYYRKKRDHENGFFAPSSTLSWF